MLCEKCQKRPAAVHMTKILNGEKTEANLCEICAGENQHFNFGFDPKFMLQNIFADLFNEAHAGNVPVKLTGSRTVKCESCGFTESHFARLGRLGCSKCYDVFESKLDPLLRRVHGNSRHTGKVPARTGGALLARRELENLRQALQQAVSKEDYEEAARMRDEIRKLEEQLGREGA